MRTFVELFRMNPGGLHFLDGEEQHGISVIMMDIDYFKKVNDTYGHAAGDEVLKTIADLVRHSARGSDLFCRYGGEEFLMVLPGATMEIARRRAEQLRQRCAETVFEYRGQKIQLTVSIGVATYPTHGAEMDAVLNKADQALYTSKNTGRNQVTVWAEDQPLAVM
jgi:diguanylate cyclase (GGDEF)-like protein